MPALERGLIARIPGCRCISIVAMRNEQSVLSQLVSWAEQENIRSIILTSSRADPQRSPDLLSDYDVEVYVRDTTAFTQNDIWLAYFGAVMVRWPLYPQATFGDDWISQLALFDDGVRIDFQITANSSIKPQSLQAGYRVLVDKDGLASQLPPAGASCYAITPPAAAEFSDRLNAFWWDIVYVPKALWRGELNYAKYMLDYAIRFEKLEPLLSWYIGVERGWSVNVGIYGRWFQDYLDAETWAHYQRTFAGSALEDNWQALFETLTLTRRLGKHVAEALGFDYPEEVDQKVTRYIDDIRQLERNP